MASASFLRVSMTIRCSSASPNVCLFLSHQRPTPILPQTHPSSRSILACSRRRGQSNSAITSSKKRKKSLLRNDVGKEEDLDEDAFEALFQQLEEDLKNDDLSSIDDDDEITEQDLANLERELEEALGDDELLGLFDSTVDEASEKEVKDDDHSTADEASEKEVKDDDQEEEEEEERQVELKRWQLRRLAYALKNGRRKTSIKNLAAEIFLDRSIVLELLRDPPPDLLMLSATLPDKPVSTILEPETKPVETVPLVGVTDVTKTEAEVKVPVHVMQRSWSAQKRMKKVHVETLERVYRRTKRPTNAMISNIVHVTNLPRKKVVKWFEDRRAENGVPDHRPPYQRSAPETVFTS